MPKYYIVSKEKIRGHHIATPYSYKPKGLNRSHIIVSGNKYNFKPDKYGLTTLKELPTEKLKHPKKPQQNIFGFNPRGFGTSQWGIKLPKSTKRKSIFEF